MKKPYMKISATLASIGAGIFFLERYGLNGLKQASGGSVRFDPNILGILVVAPFVLIIAAAIIFMVGKMRRL